MPGLDRAAFVKLRAAASGFVSDSHGSYLAEALQSLRRTGDPLDALRLLVAMGGSSYASRPDQMKALNDVGKWLEDRLYYEPRARADAVALELGWLRRLAKIAEKNHDDGGGRERAPRGAPVPALAFGKRIVRIEERRLEAASRASAERNAAPKLVAAPPPDRLPPFFLAELVDFSDARNARRTARERRKAGKAPKDRALAIRPVDPALAVLAAGLACSIMETEGFDAPFEAAERNGGAACGFYVTKIEERDGKRLVRAIAMAPPAVGAQQ